jgi:hypothetical protein
MSKCETKTKYEMSKCETKTKYEILKYEILICIGTGKIEI